MANDPTNVQVVKEWKAPRCTQAVKKFLGFVEYYWRFCLELAAIMTLLSSKEVQSHWAPTEEAALQQLKCPDPAKQFILDPDASSEVDGAVLPQMVDGEDRVVAYYSKTFSPPQMNYSVIRRELLAVVMAVTHFRPYPDGQEFGLRTDHASLLWLYKWTEPSHQVVRWLESIAEFSFLLERRAETKN